MAQPSDNPPAAQSEAAASPKSRGRLGLGRRGLIILAVAVPVLAFLGILTWALLTAGPARGGLAVNNTVLELNVDSEAAPEFTLTLMGGAGSEERQLSSGDLRGQVVMLDFWASWCPPCRDEAPTLAQVYAEYQGRGVEFVGFNLWDNVGDAEVFLQQEGHQYPNGVDEGGRIAISYGVRGIPEKFFLTRDGRIARKFSGPMDAELLRQILDTLLLQE